MAATEGVTKAIASFYRDDSDTDFLMIYVPVSPANFSNTWDFHLMTEISGNVPATSEDFRRLSEDFQTLPKMSAHISKTLKLFQSYLKDDNFSVF